ncbi:MAG TPA: HIT domain-containing protein [Thermomicrobiales bacterium]|nr:HIT domain-containing protein [Thermomicrobiales bacterium]
MDDCIFCRIVARRAPAYVVAEDGATIVFLSLEGHPLVVPKAHLPDVFALDDDLGAAIMRQAIRVARAVRAGLGCDGVYLGQANGAAAGQDVFHFHLHVYPRWHDPPAWAGQTDAAARAALRAKIAAAL